MSKTIFLTGASSAGKGVRIRKLVDHLIYRGETLEIISDHLSKNNDGDIISDMVVGYSFPNLKLFFVGLPSKRGDSWSSIDHMFTWDYSSKLEEFYRDGFTIVMDINVTFLSQPKFIRATLNTQHVDVIAFIHYDIEEAISRMNSRLSNLGRTPKWDINSYCNSDAKKANDRMILRFEKEKSWRDLPGERLIIPASAPKSWLLDYFKENDYV